MSIEAASTEAASLAIAVFDCSTEELQAVLPEILEPETVVYLLESGKEKKVVLLLDEPQENASHFLKVFAKLGKAEIETNPNTMQFDALEDLFMADALPNHIVRLELEAEKPGLKEYFGRSEDE